MAADGKRIDLGSADGILYQPSSVAARRRRKMKLEIMRKQLKVMEDMLVEMRRKRDELRRERDEGEAKGDDDG